jgi:hypothetical protein
MLRTFYFSMPLSQAFLKFNTNERSRLYLPIETNPNPGVWHQLPGVFLTKNYAVVIDAKDSAGMMGRVDLSETSVGCK